VSAKKEKAAIVGIGVAACAACCVGPILGVLAAIGLGTAAGFALFGVAALVVGAAAAVFVVGRRRRHRVTACAPTEPAAAAVPIEMSGLRSRS
jgi:hypothetical protein